MELLHRSQDELPIVIIARKSRVVTHRDKCIETLGRLQSTAYIAGTSAAALWELPLLREPRQVSVGGILRGRYSSTIKVLPVRAAVTEVAGIRVTTPAWTVVGSVRQLPIREGLMVADAAMHRGLCSQRELDDLLPTLRGTSGIGKIRWVVDNADPAAESPGETWTRLTLRGLGYIPRSQVVIKDGAFTARLDFLIDDWLAVEFDGAMKYEGQAAMNEKRRQAHLESMGYRVIRVIWEQLAEPASLDRRLRTAGARPTARRRPTWLLAG